MSVCMHWLCACTGGVCIHTSYVFAHGGVRVHVYACAGLCAHTGMCQCVCMHQLHACTGACVCAPALSLQ